MFTDEILWLLWSLTRLFVEYQVKINQVWTFLQVTFLSEHLLERTKPGVSEYLVILVYDSFQNQRRVAIL